MQNCSRKIIIGWCILSLICPICAEPYNTPDVDGIIEISQNDWEADELIADDPPDDSYWSGNDLDNIWLTWDANYIYLGVEYSISNNAMLLYVECGKDGGVTDFNSERDYSGSYPRNITFPDSVGIDLMVASWNAQNPNVYLVADSSTTEITSSCIVATGGSYQQEIAIPWNAIYSDIEDIVFPGAQLKLVGIIAGGDNWGAADALPDNPAIDGGEGPHRLDEFISILIDSDYDGIPDFSGAYISGTVQFDDTAFSEPPYPSARISAYSIPSGEFFSESFSSVEDGSYLLAGVEIGESYDIIASANGFIPDSAISIMISEDSNVVDFVLMPYTGIIYGNVEPADVQTILFAIAENETIGFGDTTQIGDGYYQITHIPTGAYDVLVDPQSVDYVNQIIEGVEVNQDEQVELNIILERAGVVREVDDVSGDDYGPGWYSYPTDRVFVDGAFDIEYVKIRDLTTEGTYQFEIKVGQIPDSSVVWWSPYYSVLNLQKIDIYVDCHSGGASVGLPSRNIKFSSTDAWDFAISADGWWKGLFASNGQDIFANFTQNVSAVEISADSAMNTIYITVDKSALTDNIGQADTTRFEQWDFIVLMLGHDSPDDMSGVRWVNSGTNNQWQFNGGAESDIDPNVIDLLTMPGLDQYGNPKQPGRTQEEMLDYTIQTPVVLESHRSYDISPPVISFDIPDSMQYLTGTDGIYIEVEIDDDVEVSEALLYWRNVGELEWRTPIPLGFRELTACFVGDLPAELVNPDSFEFYFFAQDPSANISYNPQDYADTAEPQPPVYPYSTVSPNPNRIIPTAQQIDTVKYRIAVNTFLDSLVKKFPDGTVIRMRREEISPDADTINIEFSGWSIPDSMETKSPDLVDFQQYRILKIYSQDTANVFLTPQFLSFHYFEDADSPFQHYAEENFVLATLNRTTHTWIYSGGKNDIHSNSIDMLSELDTMTILGLFSLTGLSADDQPIANVIISPNPFSPNNDGIVDWTNITIHSNYPGNVDMDIFDMEGKLIKTLSRNIQVWEGRNEN
ncbi:hypothetical protein DRQ33_05560, partial [bacterium]